MLKGKVAIVVDPGDSLHWSGVIDFLQDAGWEVEMYLHQSWFQPTSDSPLPEGAETADVLVVYAMGCRDWWVDALKEIDKPTVYISTIGAPQLTLTKYKLLTAFYRWDELEQLIQEVLK